ncbi:DNA damage-inducible transcript 3 protein [Triplophysa tibetana]|uniref:DNA damage-inducible transcript 3 protein n=1 Tax=Triplophysa tibetana TaxID=1572043 RepID=A0A5A9NU66_9TELE|nr:DNA damage-inducible transcript 3 protein [Triplophysa tibetana]
MTAEWMYPPGVGPLCGAELEAWYEDLQDILGSDAGGAKITRAPPCSEKEPEFLDVLESCSLTWLTDGQVWGDGVQRVTDEPPNHPPAVCATPPRQEERRGGDTESSGGGDLLPPEFFELLSDGGMGLVDAGAVMVTGGYTKEQRRQKTCGTGGAEGLEERLPPRVKEKPFLPKNKTTFLENFSSQLFNERLRRTFVFVTLIKICSSSSGLLNRRLCEQFLISNQGL